MTPVHNTKNALLYLVLFIVIITSFRIWFAAQLGLSPDEAYYRQWSQSFALSYLDHPPFIAWMMKLGTVIVGETELGLRLIGVLLSAAAVAGVFFIGIEMRLTPKNAAFGACLSTALIAPASAAVICTPDTFLGAFYILATYAALRLKNSQSSIWYYVFSIAFAGGFWSKYSSLMMPALLIASQIFQKGKRKPKQIVHVITSCVLFGGLVLPHIVASAYKDFASFNFQALHLLGKLHGVSENSFLIVVSRLGEVIGGQLGLLTPPIFFFLVIYCCREQTGRSLILKTALLLPILSTSFAALFTHPEQNWACLGHPLAGPMSVSGFVHFCSGKRSVYRIKAIFATTLVFAAAVFLIVHMHSLYSFLPLVPDRDPTSRLHGWKALGVLNNEIDNVDAVVCDNYGLAAQFSWHLRSDLKRDFPVIGADRNSLPENGVWLLLSQQNDFGRAELKINCDSITQLTIIKLRRVDGQVWDRVSVAIGTNCHGINQTYRLLNYEH